MIDIIFILALHWFGDFALQTRWQGNNKSHSLRALLSHTLTYSLVWFTLYPILGNLVWKFVVITLMAHTATDYMTSRLNAYLWSRKEFYSAEKNAVKANEYEHAFWASLGFDQLLHYAQLLLTYNYL